MNRFLGLALLAVAIALIVVLSTRGPRSAGGPELAVSFTSYVHEARGLQRVELYETRSVEIIERTSKYSLFWDFLKFPDLVVLARVPVRYSYYVDLTEPFEISLRDGRTIVNAPALRAGLPTADVSGISYEVKSGSLFRNSFNAFEELRKTITPLLQENAERQLPSAFEPARKQLMELLKNWCSASGNCHGEIEIRFKNEDSLPNAPSK